MLSKYSISTTKSEEKVIQDKKERVERPQKKRPDIRDHKRQSDSRNQKRFSRDGQGSDKPHFDRSERGRKFNRNDKSENNRSSSTREAKSDETAKNVYVNNREENSLNRQKKMGAYFNHSFDDFQRAIDSRALLSTNNSFWYNKLTKESLKIGNVDEKDIPFKSFTATYEKAYELIKTVVKNPSTNESYQDPELVKELLERGTFSDRLKTRASQIIENPLGSLEHLDELLKLLEARRNVDKVILVLRDLFLNYLMPHRVLIPFKERPLKNIVAKLEAEKSSEGVPSLDIQLAHASLIFWYYEDALKNKYNQMLTIMDDMISNPYIDQMQILLVRVLREFIVLIPESKHIALSILVRSLINPTIQLHSRNLLLQTLDANAFWYCPHIDKTDVVRELLRGIYTSLQLPSLKAIPRLSAITATLKHIPINQNDTNLHSILLEGYLNSISTLRLMGRSKSFHDQGNPIYSSGMVNILKGLEKLLGPKLNKEKFFEILEVILAIGEIKVFEVQVTVLRLLYRAKITIGELPEAVDKYLYRRLFTVALQPGFHSIKSIKTLSNLLFSAIVNDTEESRAVALFKRMLQATFAQVSTFTGFIMRAVFKALEEKPQLWKYLKMPESSRVQEGDTELYQLHGGNPSFLHGDKSAFWEFITIHKDINPTIVGFIDSLANDRIPNSNQIAFEALHHGEVIRSMMFQGYSSKTKRAVARQEQSTPGIGTQILENTKDLWAFGAKYSNITNAEKDEKRAKLKLSTEEKNAVDDILFGAEDDDDEGALMEIEEEAEPNADDLVEAMDDAKVVSDEEDVQVVDRFIRGDRNHKRDNRNKESFSIKSRRPLLPKATGKRKERHADGRNGKRLRSE